MITIEEDKEFLMAQREKGRRGYMSGEDRQLALMEARKQQRREAFEQLQKRHKEKTDLLSSKVELVSSQNSNSSSTDEEFEMSSATPSGAKKRKRGRQTIVTQDVASALDRTQISDRKAIFVLTATAASLGCDTHELAINRSTVRRARINARRCIAADIKQSFNPQTPLTIHWDGKILPELSGGEKVDRLAVLVSGAGTTKLLGVPKLPAGTGEAMAKAVVDCLEDWNIKDRVQAMSFDTTSSNTGINLGACTLVQLKIGRNLLQLACRHHIMEIVAEKAFAACDMQSTGPDILIFKRFQQQWQSIDKGQYTTLGDGLADNAEIEDIILFCQNQLSIMQPRDDYRELLELTIIYLGGSPTRGIRFMQPGALHRARWMARVIYAIKITLFQAQFVMSKREKAGMQRFAIFAVKVYVRYWFMAPLAAAAPANDLALLKKLLNYGDNTISKAASNAFSRHLWYLSEELISLSFFDPDISVAVKREMVKALDIEGSEHPRKRITVVAAAPTSEKTVSNFVSKSSRRFFEMLNLPTEFLLVDPLEWELRPDYQGAMEFIRSMKVVNDFAERGVALMQNFNTILTKNEDQKQFLLQLVEQHQQKYPNALKKTITKNL